ncbi:hypothetical protein L1085_016200 [Streptomyces sp. MSC1_001]|jgi:hypothetical protein|uniref:hypothetical protein n=1 Tax=Streptomyces sp. MSC1_001 TaxID=2909263 RepID=UPI00202EF68F|nr:hypothetical protein [Streptomyces sp. MSC1_001]
MAFEYRNPTNGDRLAAVALDDDVWIKTSPKGCLVPPDRVEEVIAGIRDAARTAAGQDQATFTTVPLSGFQPGRMTMAAPTVGQPAEAHATDEARVPATAGRPTERLSRIAQAHSQDTGPGGLTSGNCVECGERSPCPTYVWSTTDRDPLATWDPADDDTEAER